MIRFSRGLVARGLTPHIRCNPFLFVLSEQFSNQWSPPIKSLSKEVIVNEMQLAGAMFKPREEILRQHRTALFSPNYPTRALGNSEQLIGAQFPKRSKLVHFTNTTHVSPGYQNAFFQPGLTCRSESAEQGIFSVYLGFFSYHSFTGLVELNYRKDQGKIPRDIPI
jgi:hypothetical protein